ncbi:MAG: alkaline phosphatase family protein, partial [Solirubrobacteraceae bacterium]
VTLPTPRVSALLVLVFLGFGVILGAAAASRVQDTLAAAASAPVRLVLPPTSTQAPEAPSSTQSAEAPPIEPTPTPTAGATSTAAPASAATPAASAPSKSKSESSGSTPAGSTTKLPPVKHVFVIMLSDQPYAAAFGPSSTAPYLAHTLEHQGQLLVRYYAVAHEGLANEVALLSGQGPTPETALDCPTYTAIVPATTGAHQQVSGNGCVYPSATQTLAGQLTAKHLTWKAYVEGIGEGAGGPPACAHPSFGAPDPSAAQAAGQAPSAYQTWRNPFVYFQAIADSPTCATHDLGMDGLGHDLASEASTANFTYIAPGPCDDGSPTACAPGHPSGMMAADAFLHKYVSLILSSKAYKKDGLLVITVDGAPTTGEYADSSSCCGQPRFPNLLASEPSAPGLPPSGGGEVGALLLSRFVKGATTSQEQFNHFSLLRTIEDLFGVGHLGYAGLSGVTSFEPSVFSAYSPG